MRTRADGSASPIAGSSTIRSDAQSRQDRAHEMRANLVHAQLSRFALGIAPRGTLRGEMVLPVQHGNAVDGRESIGIGGANERAKRERRRAIAASQSLDEMMDLLRNVGRGHSGFRMPVEWRSRRSGWRRAPRLRRDRRSARAGRWRSTGFLPRGIRLRLRIDASARSDRSLPPSRA